MRKPVNMYARLRIICAITLICFVLLIGRFFYWQIIKSNELSARAQPQHVRKSIESAYRGKIMSSDGTILVGQADSWNLFAEPYLIEDINKAARNLSEILVSDKYESEIRKNEEERIAGLIKDKDKLWVPLENRISSDVKKQIELLDINGLGFDRDEVRKYPESSMSAHLLGFLGKNEENENQGYFGLEGYYDKTLLALKGVQRGETDIKGLPLLFGKSKRIPSQSGADLVTYIDKGIQLIVDTELKEGIEDYGAVSGSIVVMDPKTGGILAMSSFPSFDPQTYWNYSNELFLNPVISASFEPGSVFKVVIMASALDAGVVKPDTSCDICGGPYRIDKYEIQTWNNKYYPNSTMTDVIVHSDNVGMVFISKKLGIEKNYEYLKKFGFGSKTGIDLQGEISPSLRKLSDWSEVDLATSSFGQGIAVTPIQMVSAVTAIANGGVYIRPRVVDKIIVGGKEYDADASEKSERIISEQASDGIRSMMVEAAKSGESKWTYKKGFGVAGKTGTAQIPIEGHYDEEKTIASFIGFAPYYNPKFVMLVTLREPKSSIWASETAAPLWYKVAQRLFLHFGMVPEK